MITKKEAEEGGIGQGTLNSTENFYQCGVCKKIFWEGCKWKNAVNYFNSWIIDKIPDETLIEIEDV